MLKIFYSLINVLPQIKTKTIINNTPISNPINTTKITKIIEFKIKTKSPVLNNLYNNVDNIFNKVWPSVKLANNRTPKDTALAK